MYFVNENTRLNNKGEIYYRKNITVINPGLALKDKCTWHCHDQTEYCKKNHVSVLRPVIKYTDPVYFGIIKTLRSTGNYQMANIIFLVILWPLLIVFYFFKILRINQRIKRHKKNAQ